MTSTVSAAGAVTDREWETAVDLLRSADAVVVACHVLPDGDALGGLVALASALRSLGKHVVASWGSEPFVVPTAYRGLPCLELLAPPHEVPAAPEVLVTIDTGSVDRLGALAPVAENARAVLVIDHHVSNTGFGTHALVDTTAAASVVIVEELIRRLGVEVDHDIAALIYAGLTTDTGSFRFGATTPEVHELAARLLRTGIRHDLIARAIWDTSSFAYIQFLGAVLARTSLIQEAAGGLGLVWAYSTRDDLAKFGLRMDDLEGVIDVLRTTAEAEVAVFCKEDPDGTVKVSTRSKGRIDMGAICVALGGGGHAFAAGFTSRDDREKTMQKLRALVDTAPHLPG